MLLRGGFRDRLSGPGRAPVELPWRSNLVVWSALDLVGLLLCNRSQGVTFLAVGAGDPSWDATPPAPDKARTGLAAEVHRVRLDPGAALQYDPATGRLHAHVSIGPGKATGTLRELGLFGGEASARPRSGTLVNHAVHAALEKGEDDTLEREVVLTLEEALAPGARELVGRLLAREPGLAGLTHVGLGTSADAPADPEHALAAEAYRTRLDRLSYDPEAHAVEASASFEIGDGPAEVREAGLFGGTATDDPNTGLLVARDIAEVDRRAPKRLEQRFRFVLVEKTGIAVPELVGKSLDAGRSALAAAGLQLGVVSLVETDAGPPNSVLEQKPVGATVVNEGAPVAVVVAQHTVVVPEIVGAPEDQAEALLGQIGLTVVEGVEQQSPLTPGTVIAASPAPGARVQRGSGVALTVAVPVLVTVPDLRGRTPAAAEVVLGAIGLDLAPEPRPTQESGASPGSIVVQTPDPEAEAAVGTTVEVTLATPWTVEIPDLAGMPLDDAAAALVEASAELIAKLGLPPGLAGLTLGGVDERVDPAPIGTVIEQSPAAGSRASLYGTVDVVVVSPVAGEPVPSLIGLTQTGAVAALAVAGFAAGNVSQRASDAAAGTVVEQAPPAGAAWTRGDRVAMTLATGRTVAVPDLSGFSLDAATEMVAGVGLTVGQTSTTVEPGPPTIVLGQDPAALSVVAAGTAVALVVRAGVPNVLGLTEVAAVRAIQAAGVPLDHEETAEVNGPVGLVVSQTPAPGTPVAATTKMTLVLSIAPRVEVPTLVGKSLTDARSALDALGLVLLVSGNEQSDSPEGSILNQNPAQAVRVDRGTTVNVVIAVARPKLVAVPGLATMNLDQAKAALTAVGLGLEVAGQKPTPGIPAGIVIAQDPAAGSAAVVGTVVRVTVSSTDPSVEVPDIRQQTSANAQGLLAQVSLRLQVTSSVASVQPAGIVLTQDPVAGSRVPTGSAVSAVVSAGGLVTMPQLIGLTQAAAVSRMRSLNVNVSSDVEPNLSRTPGTVFLQSPTAGVPIAIGSTIEITVATRLIRPPLDDNVIIRKPGFLIP